ncbi:MAG: hypothetical protein AAGN66_12520 [Acidobacteriota bacterium]
MPDIDPGKTWSTEVEPPGSVHLSNLSATTKGKAVVNFDNGSTVPVDIPAGGTAVVDFNQGTNLEVENTGTTRINATV